MSVYVPPAKDTGNGSSCSGSCGTQRDQRYTYLGSYFNAHMLSYPSHRYAYIMYFAFVGILLVASAMHHAGVGDQTWLGAAWAKFAPKGRLIKLGGKPPDAAEASRIDSSTAAVDPRRRRKFRIHIPFMQSRYVIQFPSFGRILLILVMAAIPIVLTLVGADYIDPRSSMFDLRYSWPDDDAGRYGIQKRVQWGIGNNVATGVNAPTFSVPYHTWWTSGGRAGLMTNALTPIVVILALKQVPWAVLSTKLFGQHAFERLSFLHKWGGRLLFLFAAAHTIAWSIQLDKDQQFGGSIWAFVFLWPRFRWAFVSLGFLLLLVLLSLSPIRKHYYEWFYVSHIICSIGFMVAAALHHPPLAPWMWAALAWWGAERLTRAVKVAYVNGIGFAGRRPEAVVTPQHTGGSGGIRPPLAPANGYSSSHDWHFEKSDPRDSSPPGSSAATHRKDRIDGGDDGAEWPPHTAASRSPPPPAFLQHDPHAQPNFASAAAYPPPSSDDENEWELDENGDKVRRRPSRRYGPVSDLLKEYGVATARPMSGIEENGDDDAADQRHSVDLGAGAGGPPSHSSHLPYLSGPSSSADHYTSGGGGGSSGGGGGAAGAGAGYYSRGGAPSYHHQHPSHSAPSYHHHPARAHTPNAPSYHSQRHGASTPTPALTRQPRPALPADVAALLKPGYAFAQVLPGKTLRLTLRTPNRMKWAPGQWVYLNIPAIRGWQSHPFTIASAHDGDMPRKRFALSSDADDVEKNVRGGGGGGARGEERTMVLLLRARKGFTLKLLEYVKAHRHRQLTAAAAADSNVVAAGKSTTGVHLRAIVDGAYGSVERVRWGVHSTVIINCGGSGVSFGIAVLEHLCACLKELNEYGTTRRGGKNFAVKRVRFVWVCREFSHLQWIASALRRCIEMVPPEQLQVDLFVTHLNNQAAMMGRAALGAGVRPATAGSLGGDSLWQGGTGSGGWKDAQGNVYGGDEFGGASASARPNTSGSANYDAETEALQMDTVGLTQFEGEDDEGPTAREMQINNEIRKEGKLRRAHTRKVTMKRKNKNGEGEGGNGNANTAGGAAAARRAPRTDETQAMLAQRMMYEGNVPARVDAASPMPRVQRRGGDGISGFVSRDPSPLPHGGEREREHGHERTTLYDGPVPSRGPDDDYNAGVGSSNDTDMDPLNAHRVADDGATAHQPWLGASSSSSDAAHTPLDSGLLTPRPLTPPNMLGSYGHATPNPASIPGTPRSMHSTMMFGGGSSADAPYQQHQRMPTSRSASRLLDNSDDAMRGDSAPIDLDEEEDLDLRIIAELAQFGHPRFDRIIAQEVRDAQGRIMVAACGPTNLAALLRRIVAKHIDPARVRKGDLSAHVNLCMESFEWGGA